jgi:hypothetical protein
MNNKDVAKHWVKQCRVHGKGSNFFFDGPTLYSYRLSYPLAHLYQAGALVRYESYSPSTGRHKRYAVNALSYAGVHYAFASNILPAHMEDHYENMDRLRTEALRIKGEYESKRKGTKIKEYLRQDYNRAVISMQAYARMFDITNSSGLELIP